MPHSTQVIKDYNFHRLYRKTGHTHMHTHTHTPHDYVAYDRHSVTRYFNTYVCVPAVKYKHTD